MLSLRIRTLICMLVAAQAFLSAPVVAAMTSDAASTSESAMPCGNVMPAIPDGEPCPCCPDGVENAAGCLSACTASLGAVPALVLPMPSTAPAMAIATVTVQLVTLSDPPLKPPPIR